MNNDFFEMIDNKKQDSNVLNYKCNNCNSTYLSKEKINKCFLCGCENFMDIENRESNDSFYFLPFKKNLEDALKDYKRKVLFNPLVPRVFKSKKIFSTFSKAYIACNLNDIKVSGTVSFLVSENSKKTEKSHEILNTVNFDYNNILTCTNRNIDENLILEISEYNYENLVEYNSEFLNQNVIIGELNENLVNNDIFNRVNKTSFKIIKDNIRSDSKKLMQNDLTTEIVSQKKILIPVYILNVNYKNKEYLYLMNGENGKSIIDLPLGKLNLIIFSIITFGLIFLIAILVAYFL